MEGSSGSGVVEVLSELLVEVELSVLLVAVELSVLLVEVELSVLLVEVELSVLLVAVELSVLLVEVELSALLVVVELSALLDKVESSALSVVEELSTVLVDELSGVSGKLSASLEHAVRDNVIARAVIIDKKRFIIAVPFVYFYLIIHYCPRKSNIKNKNTAKNRE